LTETYLTAEIPAPGAMALLGLAGLVGRRHR
jgi:MYXO-CTERM domain-containing protein